MNTSGGLLGRRAGAGFLPTGGIGGWEGRRARTAGPVPSALGCDGAASIATMSSADSSPSAPLGRDERDDEPSLAATESDSGFAGGLGNGEAARARGTEPGGGIDERCADAEGGRTGSLGVREGAGGGNDGATAARRLEDDGT